MPTKPETDWPDGVTARILTRAGILLNDHRCTVDIHDQPDNNLSTAHCRPCGWDYAGHPFIRRNRTLAVSREHANECTALPNPAA